MESQNKSPVLEYIRGIKKTIKLTVRNLIYIFLWELYNKRAKNNKFGNHKVDEV